MRGSSCIYAHPETAESSPLVPCRDFQRGVCRRGGACRFVHSFPVQTPSAQMLFPFQDPIIPAASPFFVSSGQPPPFGYGVESNRPQRENLQICFDFLLKGNCHRNSSCSYLHVHLAEGEDNNGRLLKRRVDNLVGHKNDKSNSNSNANTDTKDNIQDVTVKDVGGSLGLSLSTSNNDVTKLLEEVNLLKQENSKLRATIQNKDNDNKDGNKNKTTNQVTDKNDTDIDLENEIENTEITNIYEEDDDLENESNTK